MKKNILYAVIGITSGLLNGVLGAGGGTIIVPVLERLLGIAPHRAHATAISVILPITMVSSFFYLRQGLLDVKATVIIAAFGVVGGITGARVLKRVPVKIVRTAFAVSMILAGIRMLWV
ncbi:MAG: Sulfite exporter TauE/SafE [Firmicutes bacterium ADurb.Bin193]|nr:MAG: Sulfite exporter TauE/SafE [Firmicutes bacterium ADurb.Bin193]